VEGKKGSEVRKGETEASQELKGFWGRGTTVMPYVRIEGANVEGEGRKGQDPYRILERSQKQNTWGENRSNVWST